MTPTRHNLGINTFGLWTFWGSHFGVRWLDSALLACGLTQAPTADPSKNSQRTFHVHFEDKSLRNVRFKNVANFLVLVCGAVKPAPMKAASSRRSRRSRDRCHGLKMSKLQCPPLEKGGRSETNELLQGLTNFFRPSNALLHLRIL